MIHALRVAGLLAFLTVLPVCGFASPVLEGHRSGRSTWQQLTVASWYGKGFHGKRTASGERFDQGRLTAAHRTLRLGSKVKVTDVHSGRTVVVRVTDRGPYRRGRGIDLSWAAAKELGFVHRGLAKVRLELQPDGAENNAPESTAFLHTMTDLFPQSVLR